MTIESYYNGKKSKRRRTTLFNMFEREQKKKEIRGNRQINTKNICVEKECVRL